MKSSFIILLIVLHCGAFSQVLSKQHIDKKDQLFYSLDSLHSRMMDTRVAYKDQLFSAVALSFLDSIENYRSVIQHAGFKIVETIIQDYGWPDPLAINNKFNNAFIHFLINAPLSKRKTILNKLTFSLHKLESYNYAAILKESLENKPICDGRGWGTALRKVETGAVDYSLTLQSRQLSQLSNKSFSELQLQSINFKLQNETNTLRPTRQY